MGLVCPAWEWGAGQGLWATNPALGTFTACGKTCGWENKYFDQRQNLHSKIMENLGWMFFVNTASFLSCVSVQVCIHGFLVFLRQGVLHCRLRDPNTKWEQLVLGRFHCWALTPDLGIKLARISFAPIDQYQQRWAAVWSGAANSTPYLNSSLEGPLSSYDSLGKAGRLSHIPTSCLNQRTFGDIWPQLKLFVMV